MMKAIEKIDAEIERCENLIEREGWQYGDRMHGKAMGRIEGLLYAKRMVLDEKKGSKAT